MKRIILTALLAAGMALTAPARQTDSSDVNRAVMAAYDEMLRENYKDYEVLYRRANEYFKHDDYLRALDDLEKALKYVPETDTDMLFQIYGLRATCYNELHRYSQALESIDKALSFDSMSYPAQRLKAEIEYELGDYSAAKASYTRLQRFNQRSQDALFGLASIAARENNFGLATEYMEAAVSMANTESSSYVRRAEVKKLMGDHNGAVDDLLLAIATDSSDRKALAQLVDMADTNYAAVMAGLFSAIKKAPRNPLYYFLRASIAASHYHYNDAIADYKYIITNQLYNYSGLYTSMAQCYYALGRYDEALSNVDTALSNFDEGDDVASYYVVRARILRALKDYDKALASAERALEYAPESNSAMQESALILTSLKRSEEASAQLGEVIMNSPYDPMPYMLRAWVLNDFLNQQKAATGFYNRVIDLDADHSERVTSLLGFAQLFTGKTKPAMDWMEACLAEPDYDGMVHYYGACFYAWAGRTDRAFECMDAALTNGYANYHDWTENSDGRINVLPLRDDPRFAELLEKHKAIFTLQ